MGTDADIQNKQSWAEGEQVDRIGSKYFARSLKGRTAGLLGYGALGRETARLLQGFGMRIVACNTSGERTDQDGVSSNLASSLPLRGQQRVNECSSEAVMHRDASSAWCKADIQYIIPGTGDVSAKIPEKFYCTRDPKSLEAFIKECDVLIASLPSTPKTTGFLDAEKLGMPLSLFQSH